MKELIEHIRAVHFALAVASIALLAAGLSRPSRSAEQALEDAMLLRNLSKEQDELEKSITQRLLANYPKVRKLDVPSTVPPGAPVLPMVPTLFEDPNVAETLFDPWIQVRETGMVFASHVPGIFYAENQAGSEPPRLIHLDQWESLETFVSYWNSEPTIFSFENPGNSEDPLEGDTLNCKDGKSRAYTILSQPRAVSREIQYTVEHDAQYGSSYVSGHLSVVGTDCTIAFNTHAFDVRELMAARLKELGKANSAHASTDVRAIDRFNKTFTELDAATIHTKALKWEDLIPELQQRVDDSRSPIDMWGAKIPVWLGIVVLLGTQIYLALHFAELRSLAGADSTAFPSGYIALYRQAAASLLSVATLTILPIASITIACKNDRQSIWVTVAVASASGLLGLYAVYQLIQLKARRRVAPVEPRTADANVGSTSRN